MKKRRRKKKSTDDTFLDSFFFKFFTKSVLGLMVVVFFLTLVQCSIRKPEAPSWNSQFVLPVINRTYSMNELLEELDQDEITADSAGFLGFSVSEELDTVYVGTENLSIDDMTFSTSETLGPIPIDAPSVDPVNISLLSISELPAPNPGTDNIIIPTDVGFSVQADLPTFTTFTEATVATGLVYATINNHLGIDLDYVTLQLFDVIRGTMIASTAITTGVANGFTSSRTISLNGVTISNSLRVVASCQIIVGGVPYMITLASTRFLELGLIFNDDFTVSSAVAQIPELDPITVDQSLDLNLNSSDRIDTASLSGGTLSFQIVNNTTLATDLTLSINELLQGLSSFQFNSFIPAGQTVNLYEDLTGYNLIPNGDTVTLFGTILIPGSGPTHVTVDQNDGISILAVISDLAFDTVSGVFADNNATFDDITQELEVPKGFDEIGLVEAVLSLEIENGINLPGSFDIMITGNNGKFINLAGDVAASGIGSTSMTVVVDSSVADFLSPLPSSIQVSGDVVFGDGFYHGTITADDFVVARVSIDAPLAVKISNAQISDLGVEVTDIDEEDITEISDHIIEARFVYTVANHLPLGITAVVHLSGDSVSVYDSPELTLDTLAVEPAPVSLVTGVASTEAISTGQFILDSLDFDILENDSLYILPQIFITGSDTAGVRLTQQDYISIAGRIEVEYLFDSSF